MTTQDILELAARVEAATAPDRELDVAIWLALCGHADRQAYEDGLKISKREAAFRADYMMDGFAPTQSLDAAMTLVPEGWNQLRVFTPDHQALLWSVHFLPDGNVDAPTHPGVGRSYALALTAAALRARAHTKGEE